MDFFLQNNSVENSLICPRAKSSNHCLTELFSIYQNKHWTIRRRDHHIVVQSSHRNIFKIDNFNMALLPLPKHSGCRGLGAMAKNQSPIIIVILSKSAKFCEVSIQFWLSHLNRGSRGVKKSHFFSTKETVLLLR